MKRTFSYRMSLFTGRGTCLSVGVLGLFLLGSFFSGVLWGEIQRDTTHLAGSMKPSQEPNELLVALPSSQPKLFSKVAGDYWISPAWGDPVLLWQLHHWIHANSSSMAGSSAFSGQQGGLSQSTEQSHALIVDQVEQIELVSHLAESSTAPGKPISLRAEAEQGLGPFAPLRLFPHQSSGWIFPDRADADKLTGSNWIQFATEPAPAQEAVRTQRTSLPAVSVLETELQTQTARGEVVAIGHQQVQNLVAKNLVSENSDVLEESFKEGIPSLVVTQVSGLDTADDLGLSVPGLINAEAGCGAGCLEEGCHGRACGRQGGTFRLGEGYVHSRELAPMQVIWPARWKWAAAEDPWPRVLRAEQTPSVTHFSGSLHCPPMLDTRAQEPELNPVRLKEEVPVSQMTLNIQPKKGRMPEDRRPETKAEAEAVAHLPGVERGWDAMSVHWNAPETTHAPLYYEEISLERGGYSRGYLQPFFSGAQFVGTTMLLPGLMTIDPPAQKQYELGEIRPGSYAPYQVRHPEWTLKAIGVQAAVVTGLAFIIP